MSVYLLRRLIQAALVMLAMSVIVFVGVYAIGDPVEILISPDADQAEKARAIAALGLDKPLWEQYLSFLSNALRGDLGRSAIQGQEVSTAIAKAMPVTLQLMLYAQILALLIPVPLGLYAAYRANRRSDRLASGVALTALSVPNFVLGILLILFLALGGIAIAGHQLSGSFLPASRYVPFGDDPVEHF